MAARRPRLAAFTAAALIAAATAAASASARTVYVVDGEDNRVVPVDTVGDTPGAPIAVGDNPLAIAVTPDGAKVFVTNQDDGTVSVIDTASNTVIDTATVGISPGAIAVAPDGEAAYVTNAGSDSVSVIDTVSHDVVDTIPVVDLPRSVAITPDGTKALVGNTGGSGEDMVMPIDLTVDPPDPGPQIPDTENADSIAIAPDGETAYVAAGFPGEVIPIDIASDTAGVPLDIGEIAKAIAISPDGTTAYVADSLGEALVVVDLAPPLSVTDTVPLGEGSFNEIALTPDGTRAYISDGLDGELLPVDITVDPPLPASPVAIGRPTGIAAVPDQGPVATLAATPAPPGATTSFDASASSDPDGSVVRYDWDFGDGTVLADGGATPTHTYANPGTYTATVTVTDDEGCSGELVFTGQTAYCNASAAVASRQVSVQGPSPPPPPSAGRHPSCERLEAKLRRQRRELRRDHTASKRNQLSRNRSKTLSRLRRFGCR